jgi:DNA-binding IclR family transcriptional regulator
MYKTELPDADLDLLSDRYVVPGLVRGLQVLGAFTPERQEMSLSDIARTLDLSRSAAFRTVYTLNEMGFLLHDARARTYRLGPAVLRLGFGYMASREVFEIALPELERLRDETDWSTHLGIRDGTRVLYMLRVPSRMGLGSIVNVGSRLPAANTTLGRVLLAGLDETTILKLYQTGTTALDGTKAPRNFAELRRQWLDDRQQVAVEQVGSFEAGIVSVAAPVRDLSGNVVAAINATHASEGMSTVPAEVRRATISTAQRISGLLGYAP